MLFLLKILQILAQLILGPIIWLARITAGLLFVGAIILLIVTLIAPDEVAVTYADVPIVHGPLITIILFFLTGILITAIVDLLEGFNRAVGQWIYTRQLFFVARTVPGNAVKRAVRYAFGRRRHVQ